MYPFASVLLILAPSLLFAQTNPPFQCTASAGSTPIVRSEGLTELVANLVLNCTGGTPTPAGAPIPTRDIFAALNVGITSRLLGGDPGPLLVVDEPSPSNQLLCSQPTGCPMTGTGTGQGVHNGSPGRFNVFQGGAGSGNSLVWLGVPIDPPGTVGTRIIRITNVRANANQLGPATSTPSQIFGFVGASPSFPIANSSQTLAFGKRSLSASIDPPAPRNFDGCIPQNPGLVTGQTTSGISQFKINVDELFLSSLRRRNAALTSPFDPHVSPQPINQNIPGFDYFSETGFYNSIFATPFNMAGLADHGARIKVDITGIPSGASIYADIVANIVNSSTGNVTGAARLINTDSMGAGAFNPTPGNASFIAPLIMQSGFKASAVYEVMNSSTNLDSVEIPFYVAYTSSPGTGTASVSVGYAPVSTETMASGTAPIPRFADLSSSTPSITAFSINACQQNPPNLSGRITSKSGPSNARNWVFSISNSGTGTALGTQIDNLTLTQTFGTPCVPLITSSSPTVVGDIASGTSASGLSVINMSSCPSNARFTVTYFYSANSQAYTKTTTLTNQFQ